MFIRFYLGGHGHGHQGATMVGVIEGNNGGASGSIASNFHSIFHGLRATIKEDGFLGEVARG